RPQTWLTEKLGSGLREIGRSSLYQQRLHPLIDKRSCKLSGISPRRAHRLRISCVARSAFSDVRPLPLLAFVRRSCRNGRRRLGRWFLRSRLRTGGRDSRSVACAALERIHLCHHLRELVGQSLNFRILGL